MTFFDGKCCRVRGVIQDKIWPFVGIRAPRKTSPGEMRCPRGVTRHKLSAIADARNSPTGFAIIGLFFVSIDAIVSFAIINSVGVAKATRDIALSFRSLVALQTNLTISAVSTIFTHKEREKEE